MITRIPAYLYRGGTSKGPLILGSDLPADRGTLDRVLLAAMGSPHKRQIDGIGGAETLTSKIAVVSKSSRPGIDVDYLFVQVNPESRHSSLHRPQGRCENGPRALQRRCAALVDIQSAQIHGSLRTSFSRRAVPTRL